MADKAKVTNARGKFTGFKGAGVGAAARAAYKKAVRGGASHAQAARAGNKAHRAALAGKGGSAGSTG